MYTVRSRWSRLRLCIVLRFSFWVWSFNPHICNCTIRTDSSSIVVKLRKCAVSVFEWSALKIQRGTAMSALRIDCASGHDADQYSKHDSKWLSIEIWIASAPSRGIVEEDRYRWTVESFRWGSCLERTGRSGDVPAKRVALLGQSWEQ